MDRAEAGRRLAGYAAAIVALSGRPAPLVAAYAGVGHEPPTRPLLDALVGARARILLPVIVGAELGWAPYAGWDALKPNDWELLEPTTPPGGSEALEAADLVVVPALAVDQAGHRLGRGGGFYDRALAAVPRERRIAIVYEDELRDDVPVESHDELVGWALTPSGLHRLGG